MSARSSLRRRGYIVLADRYLFTHSPRCGPRRGPRLGRRAFSFAVIPTSLFYFRVPSNLPESHLEAVPRSIHEAASTWAGAQTPTRAPIFQGKVYAEYEGMRSGSASRGDATEEIHLSKPKSPIIREKLIFPPFAAAMLKGQPFFGRPSRGRDTNFAEKLFAIEGARLGRSHKSRNSVNGSRPTVRRPAMGLRRSNLCRGITDAKQVTS